MRSSVLGSGFLLSHLPVIHYLTWHYIPVLATVTNSPFVPTAIRLFNSAKLSGSWNWVTGWRTDLEKRLRHDKRWWKQLYLTVKHSSGFHGQITVVVLYRSRSSLQHGGLVWTPHGERVWLPLDQPCLQLCVRNLQQTAWRLWTCWHKMLVTFISPIIAHILLSLRQRWEILRL